MYPILYDFGTVTIFGAEIPLRIGGYGLMYALAVITGWLLTYWIAGRFYPDKPVSDIYFTSVIGGVVGARVLNAFIRLPEIAAGRLTFFDALLGGGVFLGGMALGFLIFLTLLRRHGIPIGAGVNLAFAGVPLPHAVGRIGCLLGGCCYGAPTDLPWGITYTSEIAHRLMGTPLGVPLHPTPIYEVIVELSLALICLRLWFLRPKPYAIAAVWFIGYGSARFLIEFVRGDFRGGFLFLSTSQWISLAFIAIGVGWIFGKLRGHILEERDAPAPDGRQAARA